jgi:hypothetical protein
MEGGGVFCKVIGVKILILGIFSEFLEFNQ